MSKPFVTLQDIEGTVQCEETTRGHPVPPVDSEAWELEPYLYQGDDVEVGRCEYREGPHSWQISGHPESLRRSNPGSLLRHLGLPTDWGQEASKARLSGEGPVTREPDAVREYADFMETHLLDDCVSYPLDGMDDDSELQRLALYEAAKVTQKQPGPHAGAQDTTTVNIAVPDASEAVQRPVFEDGSHTIDQIELVQSTKIPGRSFVAWKNLYDICSTLPDNDKKANPVHTYEIDVTGSTCSHDGCEAPGYLIALRHQPRKEHWRQRGKITSLAMSCKRHFDPDWEPVLNCEWCSVGSTSEHRFATNMFIGARPDPMSWIGAQIRSAQCTECLKTYKKRQNPARFGLTDQRQTVFSGGAFCEDTSASQSTM